MVFRIVENYAHNVIVKHLANNKHFQRFAVKLDTTIKTQKVKLEENIKENVIEKLNEKNIPTQFSVSTFVRVFKEELDKAVQETSVNNKDKSK